MQWGCPDTRLNDFTLKDSHMLPPEVEEIFRRVQDSAHHMPDWQMEVSYKSRTPFLFLELCIIGSPSRCIGNIMV